MPAGWIERLKGEGVKKWAYDKLVAGDVIFVGDRCKQGFPVVAEIQLADDDVKRFVGIEKGVTIILCAEDRSKDIADPQQQLLFDEIKFYLECVN
ncbi:MAG: hypothetical protein PVF29_04105 [Desulfobacterales bacterium]|jgi:hypothetical protein